MDTNSSGVNSIWLPAAIVVAAIIIGGALYWNGMHTTAGTQAGNGQPPAPSVNIKNVKTQGDPYIGDQNAPVTVAFWSDYQCPYCKQFELNTLPQLKTQYVDTGKVKIVFKDLPFLGNDSNTAAEYGRSIWKLYPKEYFAWRTAMYKAQDQEGDVGFGNAASIDKLDATIPGIDAAKVTADVKANGSTYLAEAEADKQEAASMGITATPSFVVGTQLIQGAQPLANFTSAIDKVVK